MPSRRSVLAGSAAMLAGPIPALAERRAGPVRFGVIADPQFADAGPNLELDRYYRTAPERLREAIAAFNDEDLDFVVTLGDFIDRDAESFDTILPIYRTLKHPHVALLGNHDYSVSADILARVPAIVGLERPYYDFALGKFRFIVLNGNDVSLFAPPPGDPRWALAGDRLRRLRQTGADYANAWNGSLGGAQFEWLRSGLSAARERGERVVVMNHYPVYPDDMHNMWDCPAILDLLLGQEHVIAYLNGHNHAGNYGWAGGIHFVNFRGMVDTFDSNAFAIVRLDRERLDITGFGREPSRSLRLRMA